MQADVLLQTFAGLLRQYAHVAVRRSWGAANYDDAHQELSIEMWRVYQNYDPSRGALENFLVVAMHTQALDIVASKKRDQRLTPFDVERDGHHDETLSSDQEAFVSLSEMCKRASFQERKVLHVLLGGVKNIASEEVLCRLRAERVRDRYSRPALDALASVTGKPYGTVRKNLDSLHQMLTV